MKTPIEAITVTKLDAAKRQLRTAIRLWFTDGDPVAVHTLVCAAHEIIHTLFKRAGHHGLLFDTRRIEDEYRGAWAKHIKRPSGFFKHAREDPDGTIEFRPVWNEGLLTTASHGLSRITDVRGMEESALGFWLRIHHPNWFRGQDVGGSRVPVDPFEQFRDIEKREFFESFEGLWMLGMAPGQAAGFTYL